MEKGKGKYIKNTTDYAYALEVRLKGELSASLVKEFRPETMDGQSGKILHNGFTFVTNEEYEQLNKHTRFGRYVEKGIFVEYDELPDEVVTLDEKYAALLSENAKLKAGTELEELRAKVASLSEENFALKKALEDAKAEAPKAKAKAEAEAPKAKGK